MQVRANAKPRRRVRDGRSRVQRTRDYRMQLLRRAATTHIVQLASHQKRKLDGLARVQARITMGEVALFQIRHRNVHDAARALGDVLPRHL